MPIDLDRMLESCRRDQWSVGDLDWSRRPREMSPQDEMRIVQLFTDMAGIERLAGALFREQQRRVSDPRLMEIFGSFVKDEVRHSHAAQMLADFYDVHHLKEYRQSASLSNFTPVFVDAVQYLSDDVANAYIVAGELILDIALLRSIDDFVDDDMSHAAMALINRDESRHIAIDYHMSEYYSSAAFAEKRATQPSMPTADKLRGAVTFSKMLYYGQPFIADVFLTPMFHLDPRGKRLKDAFKRMQILGRKEETARRPFTKFLRALDAIFNHPVAGPLFGGIAGRLTGVGSFMERFYTPEELENARKMTYAELAEDALSAKSDN
ncbi:MAG: hypothetical protein IPK82_18960 [Polyangiaceae bacterium]|nr:hypothetical protein [Polyangiaceae bacterium]